MKRTSLFIISFFLFVGGFAQTVSGKLAGKIEHDFTQTPVVSIPDSLQKTDTLSFKTITEKEFQDYKAAQKRKIQARTTSKPPIIGPDSTGLFIVPTKNFYYELVQSNSYSSSYSYGYYIPELNAHLIYHCGECSCQESLLDNESDVKMYVPAIGDEGAFDILLSPSNSRMLVYSSHDGPGYIDYSTYRSEFYIYQISKGKGIQGLQVYRIFETGDWSIAEIVWINDNTIALKVYEGEGYGDRIDGEYKYLQTTIK